MAEPAPTHDSNAEGPEETGPFEVARRPVKSFRMVRPSPGEGPQSNDAGEEGFVPLSELLDMVPARLLVAAEAWRELGSQASGERVAARAEIPLIASLCRIRSEADAAIALTGVIETLARRFQITLPFGMEDATTLLFAAPEDCDFAEVATSIDDALLGQVRATDLQGALRDRVEARVAAA